MGEGMCLIIWKGKKKEGSEKLPGLMQMSLKTKQKKKKINF